jgi:hypothetical protein
MAIGSQIPQDILKFESKPILGLSVRKALFFGAGFLFGVMTFFFSPDTLPYMIKSIITAAVALPIFIWGAASPFGQPLEKVIMPFLIDNLIAPPLRKKEIHHELLEKQEKMEPPQTGKKQTKRAAASASYPAIK